MNDSLSTEGGVSPGTIAAEAESTVEIEGEMGNVLLVREGDTVTPVPRTPEYVLLYKHGLADLIGGDITDDPTVLSESPFVAVGATDSDRVYTLQVGDGRPVQNQPANTESFLKAVLTVIEHDDTAPITRAYEIILDEQVRREVVTAALHTYSPVPPEQVDVTDEGWVICEMFLLTWTGEIYLVTRDFRSPAHALGGRASRTVPEEPQILALNPSVPEESQTIPLRADELPDKIADGVGGSANGAGPQQPDQPGHPTETVAVTLDRQELAFLTKAKWLVNYRDHFDDDVYWTQIERLVVAES